MGFSIEQVVDIARFTGDKIIMPSWGKAVAENKDDGSPVTEVDKAASAYIVSALRMMDKGIPVISEEATPEENLLAMESHRRWIVDPLDGTQTYIDGPKFGKTAGFGVHIGLIENGNPVKGVVYFPAAALLYFTGDDGNAYLQQGEGKPQQIQAVTSLYDKDIRAAVPWVKDKQPHSVNGHDFTAIEGVGGEQLCKVASGHADLAWHDRPDIDTPLDQRTVFKHWDMAAAHAVLAAAGGVVSEIHSGKPIRYDNKDFTIPAFTGGHPDVLKQVRFHALEQASHPDPHQQLLP